MAVTVAICGVANLLVVILCAPGTWDCMAYHLARAAYYLQQGSFAAYDANYWAQVVHPVNSTALNLFTLVATGSENLTQFWQFASYWASIAAVSGIASALGFTRRAPPHAAPRYLLRKGGQRWGGSLGSEDVEHWVGDHGRMRPVGDTDGDGTGDIVTQGDDCSLIWIGGRDEVDSLDTTEAADRILEDPGWGRWTPGPAGDLDGDGIDDWWLLPEHSSEDCTSEVPEGSLVLIQGRSGGPDLLYATVWEPAGGPRIEAAVGGGDHDGDGHDDLAVLYNSDTDERGGWEILSGADVVFGADGHLTGASTWEDTYVTGAWWLDNLDLEPGHELAIGVHHPAVTTYVRVLPGGVVR